MLQSGIRAIGSTLDLYGPKINTNLVNSSSQSLICVEIGENGEIPKILSKFKSKLHSE
jgi:hypothetical protein